MTRSRLSCLCCALFACLLSLPGCGGGGSDAQFVQPGEGEGPSEQEVQESLDASDQESQRFQEAYGRPGN